MLHYLTRILGPGAQSSIAAWLNPASHAGATTHLVSLALSQHKLAPALQLAERRCRMSTLPDAVDHVLRAELLHRIGDTSGACADICRALEIAPDDIFANRKQLLWSTPAERAEAAYRLIELDRDPAIAAAALAALRHSGVKAVARGSLIDGAIRGWAAWQPHEPADPAAAQAAGQTLVVEHGITTDRVRLAPDPKHPLAAALGAANSFVVASKIGHGQWFETRLDAGPLHLTRMFTGFGPPARTASPASKPTLHRARPARAKALKPKLTVIVPVHGDLDATRACLESLLLSNAAEKLRIRILVVNDASPVAGMADYISGLPLDVLTCPANLGFVGAVNAALEHVDGGDIVLLNADTVLPAGAIGRLRAVAHAATDIGTVTPLSNNGELTSLPAAFRENSLPDTATIARIDAAAASLDGAPVDLPAGIGFCLYITRACLDAVGGLSEHYERGYGEDVHLCLAAREAGFRNVCATSIYVGHAGTRSFLTSKRRLVMRNAARVAARFPEHERELAAFVAADPLASTRHAIGRLLIAQFAGAAVIAGRGSLAQAETRVAEFGRAGRPAMLAVLDRGTATWRAFDASGALATETVFTLPDDTKALAAARAKLHVSSIDVFAPEAFTAMGFDNIDCAFELHIGDAAGLAHRLGRPIDKANAKTWQRVITTAVRVIVPDGTAHAFALQQWPMIAARISSPAATSRPLCRTASVDDRRLGVILLDETHVCRRLVRTLAACLPRGRDDEPRLLVLGATADDLGLMRPGGVMIAGATPPDEIAMLARRLRLTHMLALSSTANFGSPAAKVLYGLNLPLAQFDWTDLTAPAAGPDLTLRPNASDATIAGQIVTWLMEAVP